MRATGDETVIWGLALQRDQHGDLTDIQLGLTEEQARNSYDNFQANALLRFNVEVISTYDGALTTKETEEFKS